MLISVFWILQSTIQQWGRGRKERKGFGPSVRLKSSLLVLQGKPKIIQLERDGIVSKIV